MLVKTYDASLYDSEAEQKTYEEYAANEIASYISRNNIDSTQYAVVRESTDGAIIPTSKMYVVSRADIEIVGIDSKKFTIKPKPGFDDSFLKTRKSKTVHLAGNHYGHYMGGDQWHYFDVE